MRSGQAARREPGKQDGVWMFSVACVWSGGGSPCVFYPGDELRGSGPGRAARGEEEEEITNEKVQRHRARRRCVFSRELDERPALAPIVDGV